MKAAGLIAIATVFSAGLHVAEEVQLPPIVVNATFELGPRPSVTDAFTEHLLKQFENRRRIEEMQNRAPWYYSQFWNRIPMQLQSSSSDAAQFFTPRYLTLEYQSADWELRAIEKRSLFDRR